MNLPPVALDEDDLTFEALDDDWAKFEYAQYVVNTAPEDRPEISTEDAEAALAWLEANSEEE